MTTGRRKGVSERKRGREREREREIERERERERERIREIYIERGDGVNEIEEKY